METLFGHMASRPPSDADFPTKLFCSVQPIVPFFSFFCNTNNAALREVVFLTGGKTLTLSVLQGMVRPSSGSLATDGSHLDVLHSSPHILSFMCLEMNKLPFKRCRKEMPQMGQILCN